MQLYKMFCDPLACCILAAGDGHEFFERGLFLHSLAGSKNGRRAMPGRCGAWLPLPVAAVPSL